MSESPEVQADAITAEDTLYAAIVNEFRGLRRAGAGGSRRRCSWAGTSRW